MHNLQHDLEFERKFLIKLPLGFDLEQFHKADIEQRYIKHNTDTQRLRCVNGSDYIITYKQKQKWVLGKVEIEQHISKKEFDGLSHYIIPNANGPIQKTRYYIPYGNYTIELDCYDATFHFFMIAEVEFHSLADISLFKKPSRFGREVSGKISNRKLYLWWYDVILALEKKGKSSESHLSYSDIKKTKKHIKKTQSNLQDLKKKSTTQ